MKNNNCKQLSPNAQEKMEDIKRVTQRRKYRKDRQYNGQKKKNPKTNNDHQANKKLVSGRLAVPVQLLTPSCYCFTT